jgi:hypothetical protein
MTASSPRGTFSQAELTADRVITRCIALSMSVPGLPSGPCHSDLERRSAPVSLAAPGTGPMVLAVELMGGSVSRRPDSHGLKLPRRTRGQGRAPGHPVVACGSACPW